MISTETVFAALYAKLAGVANFITAGRRLVNVQDLNPEQFPAAFQLEGKQTFKYSPNSPPVLTLRASWVLYTYQTDPTAAQSTPLNLLLDAVRTALAPTPGLIKNTLGGLVEYVAIDGDIEIFEGVLGERAVAIVPLVLVMPGF